MTEIALNLCFKGNREYLQGGDLYTGLIGALSTIYSGEVATLRLAFHRFVRRQPNVICVTEGSFERSLGQVAGDFAVAGSDGPLSGWLTESDRVVDCRIAFDESVIEANCSIRGQSISIHWSTGYAPIEVAVSMTKQLHNQLFPVSGKRWIFSKLDLKKRLFRADDAERLRVVLSSNMNDRLTSSDVVVDNDTLGKIYFSAIPI